MTSGAFPREPSGGKVGYPPISDVVWDEASEEDEAIGPSGRARRTFEDGRVEDEDAGDGGAILSIFGRLACMGVS